MDSTVMKFGIYLNLVRFTGGFQDFLELFHSMSHFYYATTIVNDKRWGECKGILLQYNWIGTSPTLHHDLVK